MNTKRICLLLALLLAFVLTACASPKFTYGTYVSGDGSTELQLKADGTFAILQHSSTVDFGTFSIQGSRFTWETSSYCDQRGTGKATYTWTYQNATLVLKASGADPCSDRQAGIDRLEYHLKP